MPINPNATKNYQYISDQGCKEQEANSKANNC